MKKKILVTLIVLTPFIVCISWFLWDWAKAEITFQRWLSENNQRIDFSLYFTGEGKQFREYLLTKVPLGSSEEEVKAFYLANADRNPLGKLNEWKPREGEVGYEVILWAETSTHSHIFSRLWTSGQWRIIFVLDPVDHYLTDIDVIGFGINL